MSLPLCLNQWFSTFYIHEPFFQQHIQVVDHHVICNTAVMSIYLLIFNAWQFTPNSNALADNLILFQGPLVLCRPQTGTTGLDGWASKSERRIRRRRRRIRRKKDEDEAEEEEKEKMKDLEYFRSRIASNRSLLLQGRQENTLLSKEKNT